jgi:hypothetical protein
MKELLSRLYEVSKLEGVGPVRLNTKVTLVLIGGPSNFMTETYGTCPSEISFECTRSEAARYQIGSFLWLSLTEGKG